MHLATQLILVPLGYWTAFALRFDGAIPPAQVQLFLRTLPIVLAIRLASFAGFRLQQCYWHHFGIADGVKLVKAVTLSSGGIVAALFLTRAAPALPRSVLVLDWLVAIFTFAALCGAVRLTWEAVWPGEARRRRRVLVIGAGAAGERLLRQVLHGQHGELRIVGLLDDDRATRGMRLHGVPVLGGVQDAPALVVRQGVDLLIIAVPSATGEQMRRIVQHCAAAAIDYKILPSLDEHLNGRPRTDRLRDVQIEDLLGRAPVALEMDLVRRELGARCVMVTGGAGSVGSELARQIARLAPARLVLLEQAESPLYMIHQELLRTHPGLDVVPVIADIADADRVDQLFAAFRPEFVFHAAAYKHVPLMETNVREAVRNNVLGTLHVAESAARHGARRFTLISTDKAVRPSSVMGATKRVAERITLGWPAHRQSGTDFRAVRFGNVLGSDGSVVPLFKRQLAAGGPLTVTHRDVRRYFMTIPEASQLVLQASCLPEAARRICMLEMGRPVRILELAEQLIRLSGLTPYRDVEIVFTGLRMGEKLDEELVAPAEAVLPTAARRVNVVSSDAGDGRELAQGVGRLAAAVAEGDMDDLVRGLCALVPEYAPASHLSGALARADGTHGVDVPADAHIPLPVASELRAVDGAGQPGGEPAPRRRSKPAAVVGERRVV
jgi:FlaA1/EpsC-like NDP-sugar epimerase